jgi:F-type H+-transporting ATPase subunit delta
MEKRIDPELIGGFVLELDNLRWDASLSGELKKISGKLTELNRRQSM